MPPKNGWVRNLQSARTSLFILFNLGPAELRHVLALFPSLVPRHRPLERCFDFEPRLPSEIDTSPAGIQSENMVFVHAGDRIAVPGRAVAPHLHQFVGNTLDRPDVFVARSEVIGGRELRMLGEEILSQHHVAMQRLEYVLPRTDGTGLPDQNWSSGAESTDQIRNEPVLGPVTTANDIAGARCGKGHMVFVQPVERKE